MVQNNESGNLVPLVITYAFKNFIKVGGSSILQQHSSSLSLLLSTVYPEHDWKLWRFSQTPRHFWDDPINQREFMDWLSAELKIKDMSDWYKVTKEVKSITNQILIMKDFKNHGGSSLLLKHNGSVQRVLCSVYPDYNWQVNNFPHIPRNYWSDVNNQRQFMDSLAIKLNIKQQNDWYKITKEVRKARENANVCRIFKIMEERVSC